VQARLADGGILEGRLEEGVAVYRGVRYAQPPFGALRFEPPEPVPPWTGVKPALAFAPASPQAAREPGAALFGGEDCLALNVWAPTDASAGCAVMVWIPGGAYMRGDAADAVYDGAAFARQGIVFVSVNYRVGVDGFMAVPGAPANRGLLDQIAALHWVQKNIAAFGGDPSRVTVAGGSAGAGAIACLMGMPSAEGLFGQVILQSPSLATHTADEAAVAAKAVATLLGVPLLRDAIARVPLTALIGALKRLADDPALRRCLGFNTRNFFPIRAVVDGELLKAPPLQAMANTWRSRAPGFSVLVGSNREEMRLYAVPTGVIERTTEAELNEFARDAAVPGELVALYAVDPITGARRTPGEMLCAMQSDFFYRHAARQIARDASAAGVAAYRYEFDWPSPRCEGRLGAAHGLEVPFVFDRLDTTAGAEITGAGAPQALADAMHGTWVKFVKEGDPGWPRVGEAGKQLMHFDEPSRFAEDAAEVIP
jgi:para-nitrobenzyl esterase